VVAPPPNRQTLASSGFVPQSYDYDDLEVMGMYVYLAHDLLLDSNTELYSVETPQSFPK
jgi:hypothetical protein